MVIPFEAVGAVLALVERAAVAERQSEERRELVAQQRAAIEVEGRRILAEIDLAGRRMDHQREVLLRMLAVAETAQRVQADTILAVFTDAKSLLESHQRSLIEEKRDLSRALLADELSPQRQVLIGQRQNEIDRALAAIDLKASELAQRAMVLIKSCQPQISMSEAKLLVRPLQ